MWGGQYTPAKRDGSANMSEGPHDPGPLFGRPQPARPNVERLDWSCRALPGDSTVAGTRENKALPNAAQSGSQGPRDAEVLSWNSFEGRPKMAPL